MKHIAVLGTIFLGLVFTGSALGDDASSRPETVPVELGDLQETLVLDGVIEAVQQSTVSAQTSGTVEKLPFDVDDSVVAGDLIVQLEGSEQRSRVTQAQGGRDEARAAFANAQQQFARVEAVHERGLVSRQEFDQAQNNLAGAKARLERAEAALAEAREQLSYTRITAPYGGILTERHVEIGESVSPGQPLLSGLSLEQLRVVVDLPQQYADLARRERQAQVTLADGRVLETGEITFYPYANPATHTFRLRMRLSEPNGSLFPGMLVKVGVPVATRNALWIPVSSLVRRSELRAVFVLDDQERPRLRQVRVGTEQDGRLEILAGLSQGERVVIHPGELIGTDRLNLSAEPASRESVNKEAGN
ncbi:MULTISPECIES: efflux RND transporter periplasmic adaptor subunit [unclassified Marinobacter]|uniref:efflux RND transporter periplasmic adaptor subunit n=1 Tax=unclassified Marinobacter TaxID=83889 RepID=UPI0026E2976A|nr:MULTISPECIES: efflux RND transporter periplasmic adaptor subunit [unclassified Marinobacter]MDO6443304.1 efflux RND transporter periplasmic adaptor subunit [Marinobacter sp. 2_MG-2023]MDO6824298.1 efflux RND transporter periplasmic adaptor subunit [Marinobacter sp. 1_MG-2023]